METIKFAQQGVRQKASLPIANNGQILRPGNSFIFHDTSSDKIVTIEKGTIGIVHKDNGDCTVSVIRDDCKAARKAIRLAEATPEEIEGIVRRKKEYQYKKGNVPFQPMSKHDQEQHMADMWLEYSHSNTAK